MNDVFVDKVSVIVGVFNVVYVLNDESGFFFFGKRLFELTIFTIVLDIKRVFWIVSDVQHVFTKLTELHSD